MSPDELFLERLLTALDSLGLEALIVGSVAAAVQGSPILTQDVDLLIRDTEPNREKLVRLAAAIGAARPIAVSELSTTLTLIGGALPVDILFDRLPGNLSFPSLRSRSVQVAVGAAMALVASLSDVIASKESAGRPKDLAQLPILRETLRVKRALEEAAASLGGKV